MEKRPSSPSEKYSDTDLSEIFGCASEDIAHSAAEISENTKAYIGKLEPGIFDILPQNLGHIYTKYPEERIQFRTIKLGTGIKDGPSFQSAIEEQGMKVYPFASDMLNNPDFKVMERQSDVDLVEVSTRSLGFEQKKVKYKIQNDVYYEDICKRAGELGLEPCPAEVGPQYRLQNKDQVLGEDLVVVMEAISGRGGDIIPLIFNLLRDKDGLCLGVINCPPLVTTFRPGSRFLLLRPRRILH